MEDLPVSVCIPTYNRGFCIKRTVESILNSTYKNLHIFIVDNASTDNTEEVVKSINDKRIRYVKCKEHLPVNYNFIRCFNLADTEIVCLFHSDDWYYPNIIENELKYIIDEGVGAVFTLIHHTSEEEYNKIFTYKANAPLFIYDYKKYINEALVRGTLLSCPTFMTKKSVLSKVGILNKTSSMISDMSFWLPIVRKFKIININMYGQNYIKSDFQLSKAIFKERCVLSPQFIILDNEIDQIPKNIIEPHRLVQYKKRKRKELFNLILTNAKNNNRKEVLRYTKLFISMEKLTIQNVSGTEKSYLNKLYHTK